jgi:hypothetical protein
MQNAKTRLKFSYAILLIFCVLMVLLSLYLNFQKAGQGVAIDAFIAWVVFMFSQKRFTRGFIIIGGISLINFILYNLYCSTSTAMICQRNLFVISGTSFLFFGIIWLAILTGTFIIKVFGFEKDKHW